jgi:hypothetical protein
MEAQPVQLVQPVRLVVVALAQQLLLGQPEEQDYKE